MRTLGYVILGLLARESRTGYDLARAMDRPIGYMWTAGHNQIYPELAALQSAGLVRHRVIDGPGPRETKRYSITPRGVAALTDWTDSPLRQQPARSELMVRVRNLWLISAERAHAFVTTVRVDHEAPLATYREEEQGFADEGGHLSDPTSREFAAYATLRAGIGYELHMLAWCDWLVAELSAARSTTEPPSDGVK
jgi:DNA-binding PadR family transcriptional regulator